MLTFGRQWFTKRKFQTVQGIEQELRNFHFTQADKFDIAFQHGGAFTQCDHILSVDLRRIPHNLAHQFC